MYYHILDKYVYTSGTPQGQVNRIIKVQEARSNVPLGDRLETQLSFEDVNHIGLKH